MDDLFLRRVIEAIYQFPPAPGLPARQRSLMEQERRETAQRVIELFRKAGWREPGGSA